MIRCFLQTADFSKAVMDALHRGPHLRKRNAMLPQPVTAVLLAKVLLFCSICGPTTTVAQTAQSAGPTLIETMNFINEKLQQRGSLEYTAGITGQYSTRAKVTFEGFRGSECEQIYRKVEEAGHESWTHFAVIHLNQADPLTVAIKEPEGVNTAFAVTIAKVAFSSQTTFHRHPAKAVSTEDRDVQGVVQSIDANSLTVLPFFSGTPLRFSLDRSTKFYLGELSDHAPKAKMTDIAPGDRVFALLPFPSAGQSRTSVYIQKVPGAVAPALTDPETLLTSTREVGLERKEFTFGYSKERNDVDRMAKAMIHAIVLCQKDQKPSLF